MSSMSESISVVPWLDTFVVESSSSVSRLVLELAGLVGLSSSCWFSSACWFSSVGVGVLVVGFTLAVGATSSLG